MLVNQTGSWALGTLCQAIALAQTTADILDAVDVRRMALDSRTCS
jgi:hypothetical protein